jgi:flagellar biosynthesis/type III secretory pathway chaperone
MNSNSLNNIILKEREALAKLLKLLEEQHSRLIKNDIFGLEEIVGVIQSCNKEIAEAEVERRKLVEGKSMRELINSSKDEVLDNSYRNIQKLLNEVMVQKDTNEMLIKQGLGFSTRMLNILNPDRNTKTYNSYGKMGR